MIVADTNLLVYLHLESEFTARARHVHTLDHEWVFPPVTRSEATNVLATLTREMWIDADAAAVTLSRIEPRIVAGFRDVSMKAALELAIERGVSAYDAQFVVLARQLGVFLVTEDGRLKKCFPEVALSMESFIERSGRSAVLESRAVYGGRRKR
jgi:predicted nucleic acid-binding protein